MKSIKEKAKAYDEALEKARQLCAYPTTKPFINDLQDLFPELAESEDERIRKEIIDFIADKCNKNFTLVPEVGSKWITWLEKQGEQYDIKPKFITGQTIRKEGFNDGFTITKIENGFYYNTDGDYFPLTDQDNWELVEQKPAWSEEDEKIVKNLISTLSNLYARNLIEKETKEKYTNLLKSLKDRVQTQPRQEWSDVDMGILFRTIDNLKFLKDNISTGLNYAVNIIDIEREINWLKSLRPQPKQEWSEEDEGMVTRIVESLSAYADKLQYEGFCHNSEVLYEQINWLKSLRPQSHWRPSDKQMDALEKECIAHSNYELCRLLEQLKKLKE